jgi:hypothetical protein
MPSDLIRGWAPVRVNETRQEQNMDSFNMVGTVLH